MIGKSCESSLQGNKSGETIKTTNGIGNGNSFEAFLSSSLVDMLDVLQHQLKNLMFSMKWILQISGEA